MEKEVAGLICRLQELEWISMVKMSRGMGKAVGNNPLEITMGKRSPF